MNRNSIREILEAAYAKQAAIMAQAIEDILREACQQEAETDVEEECVVPIIPTPLTTEEESRCAMRMKMREVMKLFGMIESAASAIGKEYAERGPVGARYTMQGAVGYGPDGRGGWNYYLPPSLPYLKTLCIKWKEAHK